MSSINLPFAASATRRAPTSDELENGYGCGDADKELFDWLAWWETGQIANAIGKSGLTVDDTDLLRLAKAVRSQGANYRAAGGTANALTATLDPAPAAWSDLNGMPLRLRIGTTNSGAATLNVNVLGAKNVRTLAGAALSAGDLFAGSIMEFIYDQTSDTVLVVNLQKGVGPYSIGGIYSIASSRTWNRPAGCRAILVEGLGGGGAGGGSGNAVTDELSQGAGGGAGGYFRKLIVGPDASYVVTIGGGGAGVLSGIGSNGGTTSWGSVCSATGGTGGQLLSSGTSSNGSAPGGGGSGSGGDIVSVGGSGFRGVRFGGANGFGGDGASTIYGSGGYGRGVNGAGGAASGYGAGGGGSLAASANGFAGGNGAPGIVVVWEFY